MRDFNLICGTLMIVASLAVGAPPEASVATAHRLAQARTDAQPVLKDDLAGQKRTNGGESAGNSSGSPNSSPDIGKVLAEHVAANPPAVLYIAPFHCPPCITTQQALTQVKSVQVTTVVGGADVYPTLRAFGHEWVGALTAGQIEAIAREYRPKPSEAIPQAVSIGKIPDFGINAILAQVSTSGGASTIKLGSASVYLPPKMPAVHELSPTGFTITFTDPNSRPVASAYLVRATIAKVVRTRTRLVVSLVGLPDLEMEVAP